ncbi:DNA-processing protein DprA [Fuscibacter oryzae]|uniref:DNA-protecting protein DprA n=1 Tax=Fuscibacter oryzae TaxID=2803939 RepID=A0A8J7MLU5_9RHOB|nr:DNA-processing protein DprA [Fuscibacter oryzae]MBL4926532.1 DNA-protecting protein DprA [Fuscibacter oryzae]
MAQAIRLAMSELAEQAERPEDWLRLIRSRRVGPATFYRLLAEHGSVAAALAALPGIARSAGVDGYEACPTGVIARELSDGHKVGATPLLWAQPGYPVALTEVPDAPPVLWALGDLSLLARPMVAMVGARNASSLGLRMARRLAEGLGETGQVVVSGLARGIDAEAHRAALPTGTVAVLAGGVDVAYPEENADLLAEIAQSGCVVSEQPPGCQPQTRHFPMRNRIISGMARGVVVVEAAARSGSLITARDAADQGRDVLAVPGHPFDARAAGCNRLLRDGAILVRGPQDVLEALNIGGGGGVGGQGALALRAVPKVGSAPEPRPVAARPAPQDLPEGDLPAAILDRLGPSPLAEDQLIRDLGLTPQAIAPALLLLELEGRVLRQPGGLLSRTDQG